MVEIPDDVATRLAQIVRTWRAGGGYHYADIDELQDALDPPPPPPTLAERMVEASRRSGFGDSAEDGMVRALAVVRAAVNDIPYEGADDRFDPVLDLLGGGSDG